MQVYPKRGVAETADAPVSGTGGVIRAGSTPAAPTIGGPMDIPETVCVLGVPYRVERGGCEPDENGWCSPSKRVIAIREGLCPEEEAQTFLHELLHAILQQLARTDEYEDEHLVQGLAIGLHQALFR